MLRHNVRSSDLARCFVDDGDDLQMTPSFLPNEENSSLSGNISVAVSVVKKQSVPSRLNYPKLCEQDCGSESSSIHSDKGSYIGRQNGEIPRHRSNRVSVIEKIISTNAVKKGLNNAQKLLGTRNVKSFLMKSSSSRTLTDYQEMEESEETTDSPLGSAGLPVDQSFRSIRSARINVASGRSLLVRQNAQVMGRPSAAQHEWDIGSVLSSTESSSSKNASSSRSGRNLVCDNGGRSVRSDISRLTGDSFRSRYSDFSTAGAMFIGPEGRNLLGVTDEDSDMSNNLEEEMEAPSSTFLRRIQKERSPVAKGRNQRERVKDFVLSADDDFSQISELNLRGANSDDGLFSPGTGVLPVRERVLSDSEFLFETLRRKRRLSLEQARDSLPVTEEIVDHMETSPTNLVRSVSYSDFLFPPPIDELDQVLRPRCFSESNVEKVNIADGFGMNKFLDNFDFEKDTSTNIQRNGTTVPNEFHRILMEGASKLPGFVLPTFGRAKQPRRGTDSIPLLSDHDDDHDTVVPHSSGGPDSSFEEEELGSASAAAGSFKQAIQRPRTNSASNLEVKKGSCVKQQQQQQAVLVAEPRRAPLQAISRVSAVTATNAAHAAKKIASVLRPPVVASLPSRASKAYDYYWNTSDEPSTAGDASQHEVLWSLGGTDSFDDMF